MQRAQFPINLTAQKKGSKVNPAAAQSAVGDWSLWKSTKVPDKKRLRYELSAFFVPASWWGAFERVLSGAAWFPLCPLRPTSSKTYPATLRMVSLCGWFEQHHTLETAMSKQVTATFNDTQLTIIDRDGQQWLTAADIAKSLGYKSTDAVTKIFNRNKDEFDSSMSLTPKLGVNGKRYETRIFNQRGCHLIGMFAKTAKAKAFRKFVLDTLEGQSTHSQIDHQSVANEETLWICTQRNGQFVKQERADVANVALLISQYLPDHVLLNRNVAQKVIEQTTEALQQRMSKVATEAFLVNTHLHTRLGLVESKGLVVGSAS